MPPKSSAAAYMIKQKKESVNLKSDDFTSPSQRTNKNRMTKSEKKLGELWDTIRTIYASLETQKRSVRERNRKLIF